MIIYIILGVIFILLMITTGIIWYVSWDDSLKAKMASACLIYLVAVFTFYLIDYHALRKNVEVTEIVGTISDKETIKKKKGSTQYILYVNYESDTDKNQVYNKEYKKWSVGEKIEGQKIYFTSGITNINSYEYVWMF